MPRANLGSNDVNKRWQRVKEIYQEALVRDPSLRKSYLFEACGGDETLLREVNELLQYDAQAEAESFLAQPAFETPEGAAAFTSISAAGTEKRFGPYEIHAMLGEGGMGRVYDATDMGLGRRVAAGPCLGGRRSARLVWMQHRSFQLWSLC